MLAISDSLIYFKCIEMHTFKKPPPPSMPNFKCASLRFLLSSTSSISPLTSIQNTKVSVVVAVFFMLMLMTLHF